MKAKNNRDLATLIDVLLKLKTEKALEDFLIGILTPKEIFELSRRLEIVRLLKTGIQHQAIAKKLGVGVATVTRGSRELQRGHFWWVSTK
ncbi:MAG: Trp family transcriptional regulator [Candidatus Roizmanbacteria bacterium]|nr:Trp family transcriptional regulator [Candidatus Roizmanbacteria bacterium]